MVFTLVSSGSSLETPEHYLLIAWKWCVLRKVLAINDAITDIFSEFSIHMPRIQYNAHIKRVIALELKWSYAFDWKYAVLLKFSYQIMTS